MFRQRYYIEEEEGTHYVFDSKQEPHKAVASFAEPEEANNKARDLNLADLKQEAAEAIEKFGEDELETFLKTLR